MIMAIAQIIRPTLHIMRPPNKATATATGTGGRCVMMSSMITDPGMIQR